LFVSKQSALSINGRAEKCVMSHQKLFAPSRLALWMMALWMIVGWIGSADPVCAQEARGAQETPGTTAKKLNVLFLVSDDLNVSLGCYGHPVVKTPQLDRLAARGIRFAQAIAQFPLCNPSRTSFLTGLRPATTRIDGNNTAPRTFLENVVFLPQLFRQNGYFTAGFGKIFHGEFNDALSWDEYADPPGIDQPKLRKGNARVLPFGTTHRDDEDPDGQIAAQVVKTLEKVGSRPFFIAAGFHCPHAPRVAPKKYFEMYPSAEMKLPVTPAADRLDLPTLLKLRENPNYVEMDDEKGRQCLTGYYGCTSYLDAQVGIVLTALERLGLAENTIVIFFGDHGYHLGEHGGLWGKGTLFWEVSRVPLLVAGPGIRPGVSPRPVELVSIYGTLCELCGLRPPHELEGRSFAPLLFDPQRAWLACAFAYNKQGTSVLTERYRYTELLRAQDQAELYDHQTDPHEYRNLAADPAHAQIRRQLQAYLRGGWQALTIPPAAKQP